jgi:ATP-dependent Clp protease ATP-binding subunit ClpA
VFDGLNEDSMDIIVGANQLAIEMGLDSYDTHHILLAFLKLKKGNPLSNLDPIAFEKKVIKHCSKFRREFPGTEVLFRSDDDTISDAILRSYIEATKHQAISLKSSCVKPNHLILAILNDTNSIGTRILIELGCDLEDFKRNLKSEYN